MWRNDVSICSSVVLMKIVGVKMLGIYSNYCGCNIMEEQVVATTNSTSRSHGWMLIRYSAIHNNLVKSLEWNEQHLPIMHSKYCAYWNIFSTVMDMYVTKKLFKSSHHLSKKTLWLTGLSNGWGNTERLKHDSLKMNLNFMFTTTLIDVIRHYVTTYI